MKHLEISSATSLMLNYQPFHENENQRQTKHMDLYLSIGTGFHSNQMMPVHDGMLPVNPNDRKN